LHIKKKRVITDGYKYNPYPRFVTENKDIILWIYKNFEKKGE